MNGQKIANILTSLFLIGGLTLIGLFMVNNWSEYSKPLANGGTPVTAGIVAFVITFLVLILVTMCISFLKWILNREPIKNKSNVSVSSSIKVSKKQTIASAKIMDDTELIAVLTAAIHASNRAIAPYDTFKIFKVKEMITSSSSWRIFSKDDLSGVGG